MGPIKNSIRDASNPTTYFDVSIGGQPIGRVIFELFADLAPKVLKRPDLVVTGYPG